MVQPKTVTEHGDRNIAAVKDAWLDLLPQTVAEMGAAIQRTHRAVVAVEIREFLQHLDPSIEVIDIERATSGSAMRRDYGHTTFERCSKQSRISKLRVNDWYSVFAAGVGKQRQTRVSHFCPKRNVASIRRIDVLTVGQTFHQHCATRDAPVEFVQGVKSRRMN